MRPAASDPLVRLREIGFGIWDPLGLADAWLAGEAMADEYDNVLLTAFHEATRGRDVEALCELLRRAEFDMGLVSHSPVERRAIVAREILALADRLPNEAPAYEG